MTGKVEAQHRFASELLCSVTRGSKHWPYKDIQLMWDTILPLIEVAIPRIIHKISSLKVKHFEYESMNDVTAKNACISYPQFRNRPTL